MDDKLMLFAAHNLLFKSCTISVYSH